MGIGEYCKRCGEQLNYDDGFEDGFCTRCYSITNYENKAKEEGIKEALEEVNNLLGTNIKYINGEYKVVFRRLSNLITEDNE